jgi:hypothetical protein
MASGKWTEEKSALYVTAVNTKVLPRMIGYLLITLALVVASDFLFAGTNLFPFGISLSLLPMFPMVQYVVFFYSSMGEINIIAGRNAYTADKEGYKAKLATSESPYQPSRNQNIAAWVVLVLMMVGLFAATFH